MGNNSGPKKLKVEFGHGECATNPGLKTQSGATNPGPKTQSGIWPGHKSAHSSKHCSDIPGLEPRAKEFWELRPGPIKNREHYEDKLQCPPA